VKFNEAHSFGRLLGLDNSWLGKHQICTESCAARVQMVAGPMGRLYGLRDREEFHIAIDVQNNHYYKSLTQDVTTGGVYLESLSVRRVVGHELCHVYYFLTDKDKQFDELPKSVRWSSGHEEAVITGDAPGARKEFSENRFAIARGERPRLGHFSYQCPDGHNQGLFLLGLMTGATGTIKDLMAEWVTGMQMTQLISETTQAFTEKALEIIKTHAAESVKPYLPKDADDLAARVTHDRLVAHGIDQQFDLRYLTTDHIIKMRFENPIKLTPDSSTIDRAFCDRANDRKRLIYPILIQSLKTFGCQYMADPIETALNKAHEKATDLLAQLSAAFAPIDQFRRDHLAEFYPDTARKQV
jgi:hypothetical protein